MHASKHQFIVSNPVIRLGLCTMQMAHNSKYALILEKYMSSHRALAYSSFGVIAGRWPTLTVST